jgi:hypothetical protein
MTIEAAVNHRDVQQALSAKSPLLYGRDSRPVDGTVFEFKRAGDSRSFLVGSACAGGQPIDGAACLEIPTGVAELRDLLLKLDQQQLATAECVAAVKN